MAKTNKSRKPNNRRSEGRNTNTKGFKPRRTEDTQSNPKDKAFKMDECRGNDISWWNKSPLYPLATSVQYNKIPGYIFSHDGIYPDYSNLGFEYEKNTMDGGVLAVSYVPSLGISQEPNSPVNQCFNSLMAKLIENTNSANVGFQQMDLALLTLGVQSLSTLIAEVKRAIGLLNMYTRENAMYPRLALRACGIYDFDQARLKKPSYVSQLQTLIMNFNALGIPNYIDFFKRGVQMGRNVYHDEDSLMAMPYLFKSEGYYVYVDTSSSLEYRVFTEVSGETGIETRIRAIADCLSAFRNTSDLGNIMGALRRAFPNTGSLQFDLISYDEITTPSYDRNVNWQLNNMQLAPMPDASSLSVTQDPANNWLIFQPSANVGSDPDGLYHMPSSYFINAYDGQVGDEFVMESTRLLPVVEYDSNDGVSKIVSCGTEIPVRMDMYYYIQDAEGQVVINSLQTKQYLDLFTESNSFVDDVRAFTRLSRFKCAPRIFLYDSNHTVCFGVSGDMRTFTEINSEQLQQLHLVAMQSIYQLI